jgi:hypothetical protein
LVVSCWFLVSEKKKTTPGWGRWVDCDLAAAVAYRLDPESGGKTAALQNKSQSVTGR